MSTQPRSESPFANRTLVLVAAALAVVAFAFNFFYINRIISQQERGAFDVAVAAVDLTADTVLSDRNVEFVRVPGVFRERLPKVIIGDAGLREVAGSPIRRAVQKGQVLLWEYIHPEDIESPARLIDPRYRGLTVRINADSNPTALLRPGSYVDLAGTVRVGSSPPDTMVIMEYVKVVATGNMVQPQPDESGTRRAARVQTYRDITLQLRPEDGEKLRAIETHMDGRGFTVMVRNPSDDQTRWGKGAFNPKLDSVLAGTAGAGP